MRLVERDFLVFRELDRWRHTLSRQIHWLVGFSSQRTCDRRLKMLIEAGYIDRKHVLYGVPSLYFVTHAGKSLIHVSAKPDKIKVDQIVHDIAVVDTALYFLLKRGVALADITSEKTLHQQDGFGERRHRPDFIFTDGDQCHSVEVELTPKSKERTLKNIADNFLSYTSQNWVVPKAQVKIIRWLEEQSTTYPNIEILPFEDVAEYIKGYKAGSGGGISGT